jgi:hypothetical protein
MDDGRRATGDGQKRDASQAPAVPRNFRLVIACSLLTVPFLLTGCGNIEPWVKPYERQQLADPIMLFDANPVSTAYMDHVFEAREGARGALGSAGGGCGCN